MEVWKWWIGKDGKKMSKKNKREKVRENGQIEQQDREKDYKEILVEQYDKGLLPT